MIKIIKEAFNLTNKQIVLATPLILFSLLSSLYILFSSGGSIIGLAIALFLFFLMLGAFLSGWFYMIAKCIKEPDTDPNRILTEFPAGVGEYFLQSLGFIVNSFIFASVLLILAYIIGMKTIGDIGVSASDFSGAMASAESLKAFLMTLSREQLIKINIWNLLLLFTMTTTYFLLMFYPAAMFFKTKNPFISFYIAIKDLFCRKFFSSVLLFVLLSTIYMIISTVSALAGNNAIIRFVLTLVNFYFIVFAFICIFKYYYSNFIQIGGNVDARA